MARPQIEDGRTEIANEIVEALAKTNLTSHESRVLWCILRHTYGWHKKTDRISYSQFQQDTGIDRRHVGRSIASLKARRIILCQGDGYSLEYGLQKNYELWGKFATISGNEIDTKQGNDLPPSGVSKDEKFATISGTNCHHLGDSLPPSEATNLPPSQGTTKAIKHFTKAIIQKQENIILPDWINKETWDSFLEVRKRQKAVPTPRAVELLVKELDRLKSLGNDPNKVIEQSIMNNWKGLFEIKNKDGGNNGKDKGTKPVWERKNPVKFIDGS